MELNELRTIIEEELANAGLIKVNIKLCYKDDNSNWFFRNEINYQLGVDHVFAFNSKSDISYRLYVYQIDGYVKHPVFSKKLSCTQSEKLIRKHTKEFAESYIRLVKGE